MFSFIIHFESLFRFVCIKDSLIFKFLTEVFFIFCVHRAIDIITAFSNRLDLITIFVVRNYHWVFKTFSLCLVTPHTHASKCVHTFTHPTNRHTDTRVPHTHTYTHTRTISSVYRPLDIGRECSTRGWTSESPPRGRPGGQGLKTGDRDGVPFTVTKIRWPKHQ